MAITGPAATNKPPFLDATVTEGGLIELPDRNAQQGGIQLGSVVDAETIEFFRDRMHGPCRKNIEALRRLTPRSQIAVIHALRTSAPPSFRTEYGWARRPETPRNLASQRERLVSTRNDTAGASLRRVDKLSLANNPMAALDELRQASAIIEGCGAYAEALASLERMCPNKNLAKGPLFGDDESQRRQWFHTEVVRFAAGLGDYGMASAHYKRALDLAVRHKDLGAVVDLHARMVALELDLRSRDPAAALEHAYAALDAAENMSDARDHEAREHALSVALACVGAAQTRLGKGEATLAAFAGAQEHEGGSSAALPGIYGLWQAEAWMQRDNQGARNRAIAIVRDVLAHAEAQKPPPALVLSRGERMLGQLYEASDEPQKASAAYDNAVAVARATTVTLILVEALLAKGRSGTGKLTSEQDTALQEVVSISENTRRFGRERKHAENALLNR